MWRFWHCWCSLRCIVWRSALLSEYPELVWLKTPRPLTASFHPWGSSDRLVLLAPTSPQRRGFLSIQPKQDKSFVARLTSWKSGREFGGKDASGSRDKCVIQNRKQREVSCRNLGHRLPTQLYRCAFDRAINDQVLTNRYSCNRLC